MSPQTRQFGRGAKTMVASVVTSAALELSLGVGVVSSAASSTKWANPSTFCSSRLSLSKIKQASTTKVSLYRKWIRAYLPTWEKPAAEAPAGSKKVLSGVVVILKYEANQSNALKMQTYIAKDTKAWTNGRRALATDAISCVTSAYG